MNLIELLIGATAGFITGGALAYVIWNKALISKKMRIIAEAQAEGEVIKKDKILQAKEKFLQLKSDHEKYIIEKSADVNEFDNRLKQKDRELNQRREELQKRTKEFEVTKKEVDVIKENLNVQLQRVENKSDELEKCTASTLISWNKFQVYRQRRQKHS